MDKKERSELSAQLSEIIDYYIKIMPHPDQHQPSLFNNQYNIRDKIDVLERILEILRIENRHLYNNFPMEIFIQGSVDLNQDGLQLIEPQKCRRLGSGTRSIQLQPKLLLFLLFRHNYKKDDVYNIIEDFIETIWDHLNILDFKKTKTGVFRCFTNTRFAAYKLRDYGLLKFTKEEAFKTWKLSLPGILVAVDAMEEKNWHVPPIPTQAGHELHPCIRGAFENLLTFNDFIKRLALVCQPNVSVFNEFERSLKIAYPLLQDYWSTLKDPSLKKEVRLEQSKEKLKQLEDDSEIEKFYKHFTSCLNVGDIKSLKWS